MIVGITGFFCAGKDTMAAMLQQKGFNHISLSDIIREELSSRSIPFSMDLDLDLKGRSEVKARLCLGISMEEAPGRSVVVIVDDIDLSYKEEP